MILSDDSNIRSAIRSRLQIDGFRAEGVSTAQAALEILRSQPDTPVVFLCLASSSGEGWRLHEQLTTDEALAGLPVIALTAEGYLPFGSEVPAAIGLDRIIGAVERVRTIQRRAKAA